MIQVDLKVKLVLVIFAVILLFLQYTLWAGKKNVVDLYRLNKQVNVIRNGNLEFQSRNDQLHEDVINIKSRPGAVEYQARFDLGLIMRGETYYQIVRTQSD